MRALPADATNENPSGRLDTAFDLIQAEPARSHTVTTLARAAGMSRSYFAESFRARFGRSPMEVLRMTRLEVAVRLLRDTKLPIKVIAARVGYDSRTSFTQAFTRAFGISPVDRRGQEPTADHLDIHAISHQLRNCRAEAMGLVWEVDLIKGTVWWSDRTYAALGYSDAKKLVADIARFYQRIHPADRERVVKVVAAACSDGQLTWESEFAFQKADGSYVRIANGSVIMRSEEGQPLRLVGAMQIVSKV